MGVKHGQIAKNDPTIFCQRYAIGTPERIENAIILTNRFYCVFMVGSYHVG
jgi:hypothetical protein